MAWPWLLAAFTLVQESRHLALVPLTDDSAVAVVDLAAGRLVGRIATRPHPQDVVIGSGVVYVLEMGTDQAPGHTIAVVSPSSKTITRRIDIAPYHRPHWGQLSRDGGTLWVACAPDSVVLEIDLRHDGIARVWRVDDASPWMFVVTPDESKIFVAQFDVGAATIFTRASGAAHRVALSGHPIGIAATPDGKEVWIGTTGTDSMYVLDTRVDSVVARFASAGREPARIVFTPDGERAVVTESRSDLVSIYDARRRSVVSSMPTGANSWPKGLSLDGATAYVTLMSTGRLLAVDVQSGRRLASIATGHGPERPVVVPALPRIQTDAGIVEGTIDSATGVDVFRGIPYAAPPVWRQPPQPARPWTGVRRADRLGWNCLQPNVYADIDPFAAGVAEDCLFLNVWTSGTDAKRPVMLWIHGGGFKAGFGGEARHDGERLAPKGVVVVTINYRLGDFGFAGANYGLLDQIAALHWVQRNIARFGGDPNRVTIVGESAGAMSIGALIVSPLAQGLFQRAILESGTGIHDLLHPDGTVPPQSVDSALARGPVRPVSVIVGNNADESDTTFGAPARAFARLVTERGARVYRYVFTYASDNRGAYHSAEIPFVFDHAGVPLAETMSDYWVAFATTGDPNGGGRPQWPVYDATSDSYLELGSVVEAKKGFRRALYDSLDVAARRAGEVRP